MDNKFTPQAIEIVTQAIACDNAKDYEQAYTLYKKSLEYFMLGLKYEQNPAARDIVMKRVEGYMSRAEQLREIVEGGGSSGRKPVVQGGSGGSKDDKDVNESKKMEGALSSAIVTEKPNVKWSDVAGLEAAKEALKEAVILPAKFPQLFTGKRKPWRGILLYGPPGTGKSFLAKAVATEADSTFFSVSSSDLVSKWQGESEKLVKTLFEMARNNAPAIVFIDEIDSLCSNRSEGESDSTRRIKTEFLVQMQGVGNSSDGVLVLGATNVPWELDPAMRRRFEKRIYIPLPEAHARSYMFRLHIGDTPNSISDQDFDALGHSSEGCSGSDISVVVREALMEPLRKCQQAKFFQPLAGGMLSPCENDPPCPQCHPKLSSCGTNCAQCKAPCRTCGAVRTTLYDMDSEKLKVPDVCMADFTHVMNRSVTSVGADEVQRYIEWTTEFGQDG